MSAGVIRLQGDEKGIEYIRVNDDGTLDPDDTLIYSYNKTTKFPVGWKTSTFKRWGGNTQPEITGDAVKKYKLQDAVNKKYFEQMAFEKKANRIRIDIEDMTVREIREWVGGNSHRKKMLRYYLLELF